MIPKLSCRYPSMRPSMGIGEAGLEGDSSHGEKRYAARSEAQKRHFTEFVSVPLPIEGRIDG